MPDFYEGLDLDQVQARIRDVATYNYGMRTADMVAHQDAPALLARLRGLRTEMHARELHHFEAEQRLAKAEHLIEAIAIEMSGRPRLGERLVARIRGMLDAYYTPVRG